MAHANVVPDQILDALAQQLGTQVTATLADDKMQVHQAQLAETLSVWMLGLDSLVQPTNEISRLASQTGRWHHQIKLDGKALAYARSQPLGPEPVDWRITEVFRSDLPEKIDQAIEWIDEHVQGDPLVRLLIVPAFHLTAFWLTENEHHQVFVVETPSYFLGIPRDRLIPQDEFIDLLRALPHIVGRTR